MSKIKLLILGLVFLFGCKGKMPDFLFDASKVSEVTKYTYEYKNGKKISKTDETCILFEGKTTNRMIVKTNYIYNEKGLLIKEISKTNNDTIPDMTIYEYDTKDSLISWIKIESETDTTNIEKYAYYADGKKLILRKSLHIKIEPYPDYKTAFEHKNYDTNFFSREFIYENNICKSSKEYDKNNHLVKVTEYEYMNNFITVEKEYSMLDNYKLLIGTKYIDRSKTKRNPKLYAPDPEFYTLDAQNDTIDYLSYQYNGDELEIATGYFDKGSHISKFYFKNNKIIGEIDKGKDINYTTYIKSSYYENGDLKEESTYRETKNTK